MYSIHQRCAFLSLLLFHLIATTYARRQTLSTVVYTHRGERTWETDDRDPFLTSLGALQLQRAGAFIRERFVAYPQNATDVDNYIRGISRDGINNDQLSILTTTDQWAIGSAQAFMQGLYPPNASENQIQDPSYVLANSTLLDGPLGGYQYPLIVTAPVNHASAIWIAGAQHCPTFDANVKTAYVNSAEYAAMDQQSQPFYDSLYTKYLRGVYDPAKVRYVNAYDVYEYLRYSIAHNKTIAGSLNETDLVTARVYAANYIFEQFGAPTATNNTGANQLQALAGRTFASRILSQFTKAIDGRGRSYLINLHFGDLAPMIGFASLAGRMVSGHSPFYYPPEPGASFIFELYSITPDTNTTTDDDYPIMPDMYVRFLYSNGTGEESAVQEYPLFTNGPNQLLPFGEFADGIERIMVSSRDWCSVCQSQLSFCKAYAADQQGPDADRRHGPSPVASGVIGAVVTLVLALLVTTTAMFFGGFRLRRVQRQKTSELGGFKGAEKLASDLDLTIPKGGAGAMVTEAGIEDARGHERVGSWELREQAKNKDMGAQISGLDFKRSAEQRPSFDDDEIHVNPFATPVKPRDSL